MQTINFHKLAGTTASLYHCTLANSFQLGSVIFEVLEDEEDGYRSSMKDVQVVNKNASKIGLLAEVSIVSFDTGTKHGYRLVDTSDDYVWLEFGTEDYNDYYPCFMFNTYPKPTFEDEIISLIK